MIHCSSDGGCVAQKLSGGLKKEASPNGAGARRGPRAKLGPGSCSEGALCERLISLVLFLWILGRNANYHLP